MTAFPGVAAPKNQCAVFISGRGSNLEVLLRASHKISVALVVSNNPEAPGLKKAQAAGIEICTLEKSVDWQQLDQDLITRNIAGIFLAGFMKIIPAFFVEKWAGRIFNIHPSLLPKHKGLHAVQQAHRAGDDVGATIHRVTSEVDSGEILLQKISVTAAQSATMQLQQVETLNLAAEHQLVAQWIDEQWPNVLTS